MLGGVGMLAYASDFPHYHDAGIGRLLHPLGDEDRRAVLVDNATEVYQFAASRLA